MPAFISSTCTKHSCWLIYMQVMLYTTMDHIPNLSNPCNTCNCFSQYGSIKFVHRITKHLRFIYRTFNTWQFPNISKYFFSLYVCKSWYMILKSCKIYLFARKTTTKAYRTLYTSHNHQTHTVWAWVHEYVTPVTLQWIFNPLCLKNNRTNFFFNN